jgi:hypothetical protein
VSGCGCLLLVGLVAVLAYVFTFGSTDSGEIAVEIAALAVIVQLAVGRRAAQLVARS